MRINTHFLIPLVLLLPASCATPGLGTYTLDLADVRQEPSPAQPVYSEMSSKQEDGKTMYHFQDGKITVDWSVENTRFVFTLINTSEQSIKIPWDEAVYVDQEGKARRVIHDGIAYERKGEPQPATVIPRNARIDDFLVPADNIVSENKNYVSWKTIYLFYDKQQNVGQEVKLVLPVVFQDKRSDYIFTFKVAQWKDDAKKRSRFLWGNTTK